MINNRYLRYTLWTILFYASATVIVMYVADFMIFPHPVPTYSENDPSLIKIVTKNATVMAKYMPVDNAKATILFSHGNAQDLGKIEPVMEAFNRHGYSVFSYDYQGYGHSSGAPSESNAKRDIRTAFNYLTDTLNIDQKDIVLYGYSLGSGVSFDLALEHDKVLGIVVEGAFTSTYRTKVPIKIFPVDRFDNYAIINRIKVPVLFFHGEDDHVVPVTHSQQLYEKAVSEKDMMIFPDHKHSSLIIKENSEYWNKLDTWITLIKSKSEV